MKKRTIITGILGLILLISCGPRRYGCGPNRRCEIKQNTIKTPTNIEFSNKTLHNNDYIT